MCVNYSKAYIKGEALKLAHARALAQFLNEPEIYNEQHSYPGWWLQSFLFFTSISQLKKYSGTSTSTTFRNTAADGRIVAGGASQDGKGDQYSGKFNQSAVGGRGNQNTVNNGVTSSKQNGGMYPSHTHLRRFNAHADK